MSNAVDELKAKIAGLRRDIEALEYAVSVLEGTPVRASAPPPPPPVRASAPAPESPPKTSTPRPLPAAGSSSEPHVHRVMRLLRSGPMTAEDLAAKLGLERKQVMMVFHNHGKRIERTFQDGTEKLKLTVETICERLWLPKWNTKQRLTERPDWFQETPGGWQLRC